MPTKVDEPDQYTEHAQRSFFADLYSAQVRNDTGARDRIDSHQRYELERFTKDMGVEQRATVTATLGGIIPPQYLLSLVAHAARNGRALADCMNRSAPLPDVGMSVIIPRITTGLQAQSQATEGNPVATQDPVETDLSVPVRTLAGYVPVSRQTIERAAYSDQILFEDLVARVWALLDLQLINGAGTAGTILGALNTAGIATSSTATATAVAIWPKIADLIQQIATGVGGLGYSADTIIMHPRRWGFFAAALDGANRPLIAPTGGSAAYPGVNVMGQNSGNVGVGEVGNMQGLRVVVDPNIPTTLGAGSNEDRIIVLASRLTHLFERPNDPITLAFDQQAGTSLQVQLVAYLYAAATFSRYPLATGVCSGLGLVSPAF